VVSRSQAMSMCVYSADQNVNPGVVIYDSLETCAQSLRDRFDDLHEYVAYGTHLLHNAIIA